MTNRDRLLHFLYDSGHKRRDSLTDLVDSQTSFYMTRYDNEELVYLSNGGKQGIVFVFTLKGKLKYKNTVDVPHAVSARKIRM